MDAASAIASRRSIRKYLQEPLGEDDAGFIQSLINRAPSLVPGLPLRFALMNSPGSMAAMMRGMIGSYGKIDSPACLAAMTRDIPGCLENLGYAGERIVLELEARGLGSCWVGGAFDRGAAQRLFSVKPPESLVCLIALGYADGGRRDPIRSLAGAGRKRDGGKLVFDGAWGQGLKQGAEPFPGAAAAAEFCALAPSSMNRRPVRCILSQRSASIFTQRSSGSGALDAGIFMAHLAIGLELAGKAPRWQPADPALPRPPGIPPSYRRLGEFQY